jgi:Uma2 family endonuclease
MKRASRSATADDLWRLSHEGVRCELVLGEVREKTPAGAAHGSVAGRLHGFLFAHLMGERSGEVFSSGTGFLIERDPDTVRAPDIAFVSAARLPRPIPVKFLPMAPDLAVEVLCPEDRPAEVAEKVAQWLAAGTRLVWVIDPRRRTAAIHAPGREPRHLPADGVLDGEDVVPGFRLALAELWA